MANNIEPSSMLMGWLTGEMVKSMLKKPSEPVAYLYNGMRLPKLPEWDREKYPYAVIVSDHYGLDVIKVGYCLYLTDKPLIFTEGDENYPEIHHQVPVNYCKGITWYYYPENGEVTWCDAHSSVYISLWNDEKIIWANHNIYLDNGAIYFSKCDDPVPVYE